jgi:hypothetical protein
MKNIAAFILGVSVTSLVSLLSILNLDLPYDVIDKRHQVMLDLCFKLDSTPKSYDAEVVTCNNGATITYRPAVKEGK